MLHRRRPALIQYIIEKGQISGFPLYLIGNMLYNGCIKMGGMAMNCMKCGREVDEGQVFCWNCLQQMETEPIKITASVRIPRQPARRAATHRPVLHLEEDVRRLERANENLRVWVLLLAMAAVLLAMAVYHQEVGQAVAELGKNYAIIEARGIPR